MNKKLFNKMVKLCRENTGSALCDSGGAYGYNYNKPIPKSPLRIDKDSGGNLDGIYISLPHFLAEVLDEDKITEGWDKEFERFDKLHENGSYLSNIEDFSETKGYVCKSENTYNNENNLDQDLQYIILIPKELERDWLYSDKVLIAIQPHCGCDIRGGYGRPRIFKFSGGTAAESGFLDVTTGLYVPDSIGKKDFNEYNFENLGVGYSNYFQGEIEKNELIEKVLVDNENKIWIHMKDGNKFEAFPDTAYDIH